MEGHVIPDGGDGLLQSWCAIDDQELRLAVRDMGGETIEAWRTVLDDLIARDLRVKEAMPAFPAIGMAVEHGR